jgi:hypothetical protein
MKRSRRLLFQEKIKTDKNLLEDKKREEDKLIDKETE